MGDFGDVGLGLGPFELPGVGEKVGENGRIDIPLAEPPEPEPE